MTTFYAEPYDITATGFYFKTAATYEEKASQLRNSAGLPVEEFEIMFIDGDSIDAQLFEALSINQTNIALFIEKLEQWLEYEKQIIIIATGKCGYEFDLETSSPDDFDVSIYKMDSMTELVEYFVEEGLFGEIPEHLETYLDYDKMARDLSMDYTEINIAGKNLIYRCN